MNPATIPLTTGLREVPANVLFMAAFVPLLQWAKTSRWPWLKWINANSARLISIGAAGLGELGIHWTYIHAGGGQVTITLNLAAVGTGLLLWAKEYMGQHYLYQAYSAVQVITKAGPVLDRVLTSISAAEGGPPQPVPPPVPVIPAAKP